MRCIEKSMLLSLCAAQLFATISPQISAHLARDAHLGPSTPGFWPPQVSVQSTRSIELEHVSQLRDMAADGIVLGLPATAARTSDGSFLLPNAANRSELLVYGKDGRLIRRLATTGAGGLIQVLRVDDGGHIHVLDAINQSHTVLTTGFEVLGATTVPVPMSFTGAAFLPNGEVVVNSAMWTPDAIGRPLHVVDAAGRVVRSIGDDRIAIRTDHSTLTQQRHISAAGGNTFWAAHTNQYLLELWESGGNKIRYIARDVPWFKPWTSVSKRPHEPPETRIVSVRRRADGLIWVLLRLADDTWRSSLRPMNDESGGYLPNPPDGYWDSVVELLDEATGALVASRTVDMYLVTFADDDHVVGFNEDADGEPYVDIWRLITSQRGR